MRKAAPLIACGLLLSNFALAGPFGLEMGTTLEKLQKQFSVEQKEPFRYQLSGVPQPHATFYRYTIVLTPAQGLCKVQAISDVIRTSAYGEGLREEFGRIEGALTTKYGSSNKRFDALKPGSIWREPRDWMMSLLKKERHLSIFWSVGTTPLPDNISGIMLQGHAATQEAAALSLAYEFTNWAECAATMKAATNAPL